MALSSLFNGTDTASPTNGASDNLSTHERLSKIEHQLSLQNEMMSKILNSINVQDKPVKQAVEKTKQTVQEIDIERYQILYKAMSGNIVGTIRNFCAILEAETGNSVTPKAMSMTIFRMKNSYKNNWRVEKLTHIGREGIYKLSICGVANKNSKEKRT